MEGKAKKSRNAFCALQMPTAKCGRASGVIVGIRKGRRRAQGVKKDGSRGSGL